MNNTSLWAAVIGALSVVFGAWVKSRLDRRKGDQDDEQKSYDQLQEDLAAMRAEVRSLRTEIATVNEARMSDRAKALRESNGLWMLVHGLEEQLHVMRTGVVNGSIPPLPSLPPLPPRPDPAWGGQ